MTVKSLHQLPPQVADISDKNSKKIVQEHDDSDKDSDDLVPREERKCFIQKVRWQISLMASLGFMISFAIRSNFGVAKNRMISNFTDANNITHEAPFSWSNTDLAHIESSFFWGYACSQVPAGLMAAKFAPNLLLGVGIGLSGLLNILLGFLFEIQFDNVFVISMVNVVQGISLGVIYPTMHGVWRHWGPPTERSSLATTTFMGSFFGLMIGFPASATLVSHFHWSTPFYTFGVIAIMWTFVWVFVSSHTPATHKFIKEDERKFICASVGSVTTADMTLTTVPWGQILKSLPSWAILWCTFCRSWTFFLLLGNQLVYMKDVLEITDIKNSGLISSLPQALMSITVLVAGQLADKLQSNPRMSTGFIRKLLNTIGFGGEALSLFFLIFVTDPAIAIALLTFGTASTGVAQSGFNVNHFDIAPRYAPILMGFSNGFGALAGVAGGWVTEMLTMNNPAGWKWCFLIAFCVDVSGILFFLIFGKGEVQSWAKEKEPEETMRDFVRRISRVYERAVDGILDGVVPARFVAGKRPRRCATCPAPLCSTALAEQVHDGFNVTAGRDVNPGSPPSHASASSHSAPKFGMSMDSALFHMKMRSGETVPATQGDTPRLGEPSQSTRTSTKLNHFPSTKLPDVPEDIETSSIYSVSEFDYEQYE